MTAPISPDDPAAAVSGATGGSRGLMLVGLGEPGLTGLGGLPQLEMAAGQLAAMLDLPQRSLSPLEDPGRALAGLDPSAPSRGWLAPLVRDVGRPLADGRCWAEHLGAWVQPCLLVVTAAQLQSGLPRAGAALLLQQRIPLVGLLQQGGSWDQAARRAEGLPWLGLLEEPSNGPDGRARPVRSVQDPAEAEAEAEAMQEQIGTALLRRWRGLQQPRS